MFVEQLATLLAKNGVGVLGKTIFANTLNADVKSGVMVTTTGINIDWELRDFYQDTMYIVIRDVSVTAANKVADKVMSLLPIEDTEIDNVKFRFIRPLNLPTIFPRNDASLYELGISVEFAAHLL